MAWLDFTRGLSDARRWLRKGDLSIRDYCGRTILFIVKNGDYPQTAAQQAVCNTMSETGAAWRSLGDDSKAKWKEYARKFGTLMGEQKYKDFSGWDVFHPACHNRALLGMPPTAVPVGTAPPSAVEKAEEVASTDDKTFSFRIHHAVSVDDHVLQVRITPAMISVARTPVYRDLRMIRAHDATSIAPLPQTGGTVTFTDARFAVRKGERFGVEFRIIRKADGVHSRTLFLDLIRAE